MTAPARDYSVFEDDLAGRALNLRLLFRLLGWVRPHLAAALGCVAAVRTLACLHLHKFISDLEPLGIGKPRNGIPLGLNAKPTTPLFLCAALSR